MSDLGISNIFSSSTQSAVKTFSKAEFIRSMKNLRDYVSKISGSVSTEGEIDLGKVLKFPFDEIASIPNPYFAQDTCLAILPRLAVLFSKAPDSAEFKSALAFISEAIDHVKANMQCGGTKPEREQLRTKSKKNNQQPPRLASETSFENINLRTREEENEAQAIYKHILTEYNKQPLGNVFTLQKTFSTSSQNTPPSSPFLSSHAQSHRSSSEASRLALADFKACIESTSEYKLGKLKQLIEGYCNIPSNANRTLYKVLRNLPLAIKNQLENASSVPIAQATSSTLFIDTLQDPGAAHSFPDPSA